MWPCMDLSAEFLVHELFQRPRNFLTNDNNIVLYIKGFTLARYTCIDFLHSLIPTISQCSSHRYLLLHTVNHGGPERTTEHPSRALNANLTCHLRAGTRSHGPPELWVHQQGPHPQDNEVWLSTKNHKQQHPQIFIGLIYACVYVLVNLFNWQRFRFYEFRMLQHRDVLFTSRI